MHEPESPSPPRKRQRMSSPTYDQQVDFGSQEDIEAFDMFEHELSQHHSQLSKEVQSLSYLSKLKGVSQSTSLSGREKRQRDIAQALRGAGSEKENLRAVEGHGEGWAAPASSSKGVVPSPQSSFNVGLDEDIENPFKVSNTNTTGNNKIPSIYPSFQRASVQQSVAGSSVPGGGFGFANAAKLPINPLSPFQPQSRSPSPVEKDYSAWFAPIPESILPPTANLFAPASALPLSPPQAAGPFGLASALPITTHPADDTTTTDVERVQEHVQPMAGFMKASHKAYLEPSAEALELAKEKIRVIWQEGDPEPDSAGTSVPTSPRHAIPGGIEDSDSFSVESPGRMPDTPTPAGPSAPSALGLGRLSGFTTNGGAGFSTASQNFMPTAAVMAGGAKHNIRPKPFKPPLLKNKAPHPSSNVGGFTGSPLNPNRPHLPGTGTGFAPASTPHPLAGSPITPGATATTPVRSSLSLPMGSAGFITPMRPLLGVASRSVNANTNASAVRSTPAKFVTPFKAGMRPGEKGRVALDGAKKGKENQGQVLSRPMTVTTQPRVGNLADVGRGMGKERWRAFDLAAPPNRQTLWSSGLVPQSYDFDDLEAMGINAAELSQITPTTAMFYSFHTSSTTPLVLPASLSQVPQPITLLGPSVALSQLLEKGCTLATKPWVDNHWAMILWKLAGMVCLDPERESDGREKRWCWGEVMRQLLYRYERELNGGSRPPLRKICTQDTPATSPMVLCVSNITWSMGGITDDGMPIESHPELEVTDGWYRLRAQVDESLARAVRKGVLRVGRKIGVAGARLSSERKDPMEILDAYNSTQLVISGNSSHLAPWHAKLGFQMGPCISTLNHLNGDGGLVAVMAIAVVKALPLAFIEFIEEEDGSKRRVGPRNQNDEDQVNEKWKARREVAGSKLRAELDKKSNLLGGYADRLERRAGPRFCPVEDESAPDHIDNLYDDLEDASKAAKIIASATANEAGWLARYIREKALRDRESAGEEVEHELQKICPPREVRNFRVLVVRDAYSNKRPSHRQAQLTVWDALSLSHSEGSKAGSFEAGQRFMVTNLVPTQPKAWMSRDKIVSEVYLSSRRDSRWTRLK